MDHQLGHPLPSVESLYLLSLSQKRAATIAVPNKAFFHSFCYAAMHTRLRLKPKGMRIFLVSLCNRSRVIR